MYVKLRKSLAIHGMEFKVETVILDFKLSPCFESCMYSFVYFPGV